ncbi:antibiotic biosynthesis monooxygenase [Pleurocapsa sp. CCALA 161]|uniref:antibiotic biosynthesis monooxygenase family protein n=1 Tax=Pleurocapsa sp. CCALA 161 TaxID=2107688 RepID=UPI001E3B6539|nr:antibiotic biosynthesis monooxygenase [Pleurocapsa sp. CCALA 161]
MSFAKPITVNPFEQGAMSQILSDAPVLSSYEAGWHGIHLAHYHQLSGEIPEHYISQHIISMSAKNPEVLEVISDGKSWMTSSQVKDNMIQLYPADRSYQVSWKGESEFIHCYIAPQALAQIAYESVNLDRLELMVHFMKPDPLICQIILALKTELETNPSNSRFYAAKLREFNPPDIHIYEVVISESKAGTPKIKQGQYITHFAEFRLPAENQPRMIELAKENVVKAMELPGLISANFHRSLDGTRVINYGQWLDRESIENLKKQPGFGGKSEYWEGVAENEHHLYEVVLTIPSD